MNIAGALQKQRRPTVKVLLEQGLGCVRVAVCHWRHFVKEGIAKSLRSGLMTTDKIPRIHNPSAENCRMMSRNSTALLK